MDFILDYIKWRCGGDGDNRLGYGETQMLNNEGYQCCLGQHLPQALPDNEELKKAMLRKQTPAALFEKPTTTFPFTVADTYLLITINSGLSRGAMEINDNQYTTPEEKIESLRELYEQHGHTLTVINKPE